MPNGAIELVPSRGALVVNGEELLGREDVGASLDGVSDLETVRSGSGSLSIEAE